MLDIDIPLASNTKTANTYTLLFNRIATLHPTLGVTQATHFVKTIKQMPTRYRPWQSIAIIGKRDDPNWEQQFRYDRYPISRYISNPVFTDAELPVVAELDELGMLAYLTNKFNMGINQRDFAVRPAGIQYTGGRVRPNWRLFSLPESPFWYNDQVLWLHKPGEPEDPTVPEIPTGLTVFTEWLPPFTNPHANLIADETKTYTEFYFKANGLFASPKTVLDAFISGGFLVNRAGSAAIAPHVPVSTGTGIASNVPVDYTNDAVLSQYDLVNQGDINGTVAITTDVFKLREGFYVAWSTWNDATPIAGPADFESAVPRTADFFGSLPVIVSRLPYAMEAGFRPAADVPGGSKWVDNMGLPGAITCKFTTEQPNLVFTGPIAGFTGIVKRGNYGKRVSDLKLEDIRCGVIYRNGKGQVVINGNVVLERTAAFGSDLYLEAAFEFTTRGSDGASYIGVSGMQAALAAGKISAPFKGIRAKCTTADIHMGGASTYKAIKAGAFVTRTRTSSSAATDVADATQNLTYDFSLGDSVFYSVSDCTCTSTQYGVRSSIESYEKYDNELLVTRVITP
jgi:hypothetical protein